MVMTGEELRKLLNDQWPSLTFGEICASHIAHAIEKRLPIHGDDIVELEITGH